MVGLIDDMKYLGFFNTGRERNQETQKYRKRE